MQRVETTPKNAENGEILQHYACMGILSRVNIRNGAGVMLVFQPNCFIGSGIARLYVKHL